MRVPCEALPVNINIVRYFDIADFTGHQRQKTSMPLFKFVIILIHEKKQSNVLLGIFYIAHRMSSISKNIFTHIQ